MKAARQAMTTRCTGRALLTTTFDGARKTGARFQRQRLTSSARSRSRSAAVSSHQSQKATSSKEPHFSMVSHLRNSRRKKIRRKVGSGSQNCPVRHDGTMAPSHCDVIEQNASNKSIIIQILPVLQIRILLVLRMRLPVVPALPVGVVQVRPSIPVRVDRPIRQRCSRSRSVNGVNIMVRSNIHRKIGVKRENGEGTKSGFANSSVAPVSGPLIT